MNRAEEDGVTNPAPGRGSVIRVTTTTTVGLTAAEVAERVADGRVNRTIDRSSRSLTAILRANVFTLFNLILTVAMVLVLTTGRWPDAVFGGVMVVNAVIGIATEYRAKRTLDRLAILSAPFARVLRDGVISEVPIADVVLDDLYRLTLGDQVPADAEVLEVDGLEVDESLLTGESRSVHKQVGDEVLSGSAVVAGSALCRVLRVGAEGYANRLTAEAKKFSVVHSDLRAGVNAVLRVVSFAIIPIALLLAWSQLRATGGLAESIHHGTWREAVVAAVAGVVGMIPEGLVLLTSLNFALAAMVLARRQVLVQELPAVEILARVDVLCLDKTGTLTDGTVALGELLPLGDLPGAREALATMAADPEGNATSRALAEGLRDVTPASAIDTVPFSSARKWSALATATGAWVFGAPEILLAGRSDEPATRALTAVRERVGTGSRVLLLARAPEGMPNLETGLAKNLEPALVAVLGEHVRPDAAATLGYFRDQQVQAKVISGDNPETVAAIARSVDLGGGGRPLVGYDARDLPTDQAAIADILDSHDVFGRVVPEQKRAIVHALQSRGHTVAMTGDGVNDALALKDADLGIAMGNGAPATKAVARIVLVDGRFETLPGVVGQGRRVMANMERVAGLFLTKTTYAAFLAVAVVLAGWAYPLLPRQLTLVGALTIGIPAFFLALPPNDQRYQPGFLGRVLRLAIPAGAIVGITVLCVYAWLRNHVPLDDARSASTLVLIGVALWVVGEQSLPLVGWRGAMLATLAGAAVLAVVIPFVREFFALEVPTEKTLPVIVIGILIGWGLLITARRVALRWTR